MLSKYALDKFVAQDLSQLTECRMAPLGQEFPNYAAWLQLFVGNWIFIARELPPDKAALAFALIRRVDGAVEDYEEAREHLTQLVTGNRTIRLYFRCLRRLESAVAMLYQSLDFVRKALGTTLFTKGDGSEYEQLNLIYNKGRHSNPEKLPAGYLHAVSIKNDGLHTDGASLAFDELRDMILDVSQLADMIAHGRIPTAAAPSDHAV